MYQKHLGSRIHHLRVAKTAKRQAGLSQTVLCTVCDVELSSSPQYPKHAQGRRHCSNLAIQGRTDVDDPGPEKVDVPRNNTRCDVCMTNIATYIWARHLSSKRHLEATKFTSLRDALDESERNKNGVSINNTDGAIDLGLLEFSRDHAIQKTVSVSIENSNATSIDVVNARISSRQTSRASSSQSVVFVNFQDRNVNFVQL